MPDYNLGTAQGRIVVDGSGAKRGFGVAQVAAGAFFGVVRSRLTDLDQLGTRLTQIGVSGGVGMGLAVRAAQNFEKGLSGVKAVSGATGEEMSKISQLALQLGKDTVFSAGDAVSAIENLVKAGVSVKDVLNGAAGATVNLAAAGEIDLPQAAEIAANALNQFSLAGKDMPRVADLIAGAANASAIDVHDFGMSLSQAGAVAAISGIKFDGLSVAIAEMGQAGIKGSDAGTSLKTFLLNLVPTTDQQIAKFKELGLVSVNTSGAMQKLAEKGIKPVSLKYNDVLKAIEKYIVRSGQAGAGTAKAARLATQMGQSLGVLQNEFFTTTGDVKSMRDIQDVLNKSTSSLTKEQKLYTLNLLFGQDAIRSASVLSEKGAAGFDKMSGAMNKVTAASVANTRLDNLSGSIEQLRGSLETAAITIGKEFLPPIRFMVDQITKVVNVFDGAPPSIQKFIAIVFGLGSVLTLFTGIGIKLLFILGPLLARFLGLTAIRSVFSIFAVGFKEFRAGAGAAGALGKAAERGGKVFTRFFKAGKFLFGILTKIPGILTVIRAVASVAFGPWGLAIALVVAGLIILYKNFKPFRDLVNQTAKAIKGGLIVALNAGRQALAYLGHQAQVFGAFFMKSILPALKAVGGQLLGALMAAFRQISAVVVTSLLPAAKNLADTFMQEVVPALKQLWSALAPVLKIVGIVAAVIIGGLLFAAFKLGQVLIKYVLPVLIRIFGVELVIAIRILGFVIVIVVKLIAVLLRVAAVILVLVVRAIVGLVNLIKGTVVGAFKLFMTVVKFVFNVIKTIITTYIAIWTTIITGFITAVKAVWGAFWGIFGEVFKAAWDLVKALAILYVTIIYAIVYQFLLLVKNTWTLIWNGLVVIARAVWGFIVAVVSAGVNALKAVALPVFGLIRAFAAREWNGLKIITLAAWRLIKTYIITPIQAALAFVERIVGAIFNKVQAAWNHVTNFTSTAWGKLAGFVRTGVSNAYTEAVKIKDKVVGFFKGAGTWLLDAGLKLMQGLADGIANGLKKVTGAVKKVTDGISKLLPGSPIKEGPLKDHGWNQGRPGKMLMDLLVTGIMSKRTAISDAMATAVSAGLGTPVRPSGVLGSEKNLGVRGQVTARQAGGAPQAVAYVTVTTPNNMDPDAVGKHVGAQVGYRMASAVVGGAQPVSRDVPVVRSSQ